jgi:hypothetical protein
MLLDDIFNDDELDTSRGMGARTIRSAHNWR